MKLISRTAMVFFCLSAWIFPAPGQAAEDEWFTRIAHANNLYLNKQYVQAADTYEDLIGQGVHNGYLYYNLGNTYFRLGNKGAAILNFLRAKKLLPRDEALEANFKYAIRETTDRLQPKPAGLLSTFLFWVDDFNLPEHLHFLAIVNFLFWLVMIFWFYYRSGSWDLIRKAVLGCFILVIVSTVTKVHLETLSPDGVILSKRIDVKSAVGKDNVTLFELHEGAIVSVTGEQDDWVQIELSEDRKGWIKKESVGI